VSTSIKVEFRSRLSDFLGQSGVTVKFLKATVSAREVLERVLEDNPEFRRVLENRKLLKDGLPRSLLISRDKIVRAGDQLADGDTLQLFPPTIGG
jgi:molybdopterin converting factor small subunit